MSQHGGDVELQIAALEVTMYCLCGGAPYEDQDDLGLT